MSTSESDIRSSSSTSLVEKILEQGQRLRNSMVQAVLNYDPFNTEVLYNSPRYDTETKKYVSARSSDTISTERKTFNNEELNRVHKYLRGEDIGMHEEIQAIETLNCMSPNSLVQSTKCLTNTNKCHYKESCDICNEYENRVKNLSSAHPTEQSLQSDRSLSTDKQSQRNIRDIYNTEHDHPVRPQPQKLQIEKPQTYYVPSQKSSSSKLQLVKEQFKDNKKLLKNIDSIKITVYSLKFNAAGTKKIMSNEYASKASLNTSNSYFIEYTIPEILTKSIFKSRAKVNSGLHRDKTIRFCSKKLQGASIYFKQHSIHQITNLEMVDLSNIKIEFKISFRSVKQRSPVLIGKAYFILGYLLTTQHFAGEQELVLQAENSNVTLGSLKVSIQLGCDKLYFGKEFVEALTCSKENTNLSESDSIHKISDNEQPVKKAPPEPEKKSEQTNVTKQPVPVTAVPREVPQKSDKSVPAEPIEIPKVTPKVVDEPVLLYTLIHIYEVRLLTNILNSYLICRGYSREDTITSKTIFNDFKPVFNLHQIIPVLLDEDFINRLRDNYILVEVWEKKESSSDKLIGISKLSLHQLYVAYRNPAIVQHLIKNESPVIGVDWWEPVISPSNSAETGQLRALVALGSASQIDTLELGLGLKEIYIQPKAPDIFEDRNKIGSTSRFQNDYTIQEPVTVRSEYPESSAKVTFDKNFSKSFDKFSSNYFPYRSNRISRTSSLYRVPYRAPSLDRLTNINYFQQTSDRLHTSLANIDRISTHDKPSTQFQTLDNFTHRTIEENYRDSGRKTITVSDKCIQEPEVEITPSVVSLSKTVEVTNRSSKVDASTQSDIKEMEPEKDNNTANSAQAQKDFLNSFLEQLLTARDVVQKKPEENTKNVTENKLPSVDYTPTVPPIESQTDTNKNKSHTNTTFPQSSIRNNTINSNLSVRNTSDLLDSLQKALSVENKNEQNKNRLDILEPEKDPNEHFKAHIVIENALHLPSRKKCKSKRSKNKNIKHNEEILPSCYVTFKGYSDKDCMITAVIPKCVSPRWDYRCDIDLPSDLLLNSQKRLIFKVWRKANGPSLQPNFQTDIVLGFAAVDLTVLISGLPSVQGWFNIVDFSSKCNGQIKINVTPLENLSKFNDYKRTYVPEKLHIEIPPIPQSSYTKKVPETVPEISENSMPSELFSRALKRKFTELDEITQRLRQRLSAVTNDDSDVSNDEFVDEFERDLNTACFETETFNFSEEKMDDIRTSDNVATCSKVDRDSTTELLASLAASAHADPLIRFDSENGSSTTISEINAPTVQENLSKLDTHLIEGKLKIDSLLEKLSLLTGDDQNKSDRSFSSRYVSGCSINHAGESSQQISKDETSQQVLKDIGLDKTGDIDPDLIFNPNLFQQMFTASLDSTPRLDSLEFMSSVHCTTLKNLVQDSTSSGSSRDLLSISSGSVSDTNVTRQAPDGAGNVSNY